MSSKKPPVVPAPAGSDPLAAFRDLIIPAAQNLRWRLRGVVAERVANLTHDQRRMLDVLSMDPDLLAPLGLQTSEVHHTQALAWCLDPDENGALATGPLEALLSVLHENGDGHRRKLNKLPASSLQAVRSEHPLTTRRRIDIALQFERGRIFIENKIESTEHTGQLAAYRCYLDKLEAAEGSVGVLVYLTADADDEPGETPAVHVTWQQLLGALLPVACRTDSPAHRYLASYLATVGRYVLDLTHEGPFETWTVGYQHSALDFVTGRP